MFAGALKLLRFISQSLKSNQRSLNSSVPSYQKPLLFEPFKTIIARTDCKLKLCLLDFDCDTDVIYRDVEFCQLVTVDKMASLLFRTPFISCRFGFTGLTGWVLMDKSVKVETGGLTILIISSVKTILGLLLSFFSGNSGEQC